MDYICGNQSEPIKNISYLDYLFHKSVWCIKNKFVNRDKLCLYIEHIIQLSTNAFTLDHLIYVNDIIEFLAEYFPTEPKYINYLKKMLVLCLTPPTVKYINECLDKPQILVRFYDVMAKCIELIYTHAELNILLFGVIQSSLLRRQPVLENSVSLKCCYEAIETSDLPTTLMKLIENASTQTFLDDLLKLSYNIVAVSDRSALKMMQADGIKILVAAINPTFLSTSLNSYERLTVCEFVIMLLNQMFSMIRESEDTLKLPWITRNTLEILFSNIKIEMEKNVLYRASMRNDFSYVLSEIVNNCSIHETELSEEIIRDIVMLCVWPEIVHKSHWLDNVRFDSVNENFLLKNIMLDIVNRVYLRVSQKSEFQQFNTLLIKDFMMLLNVDYSKNTYGNCIHPILNRFLLILPYLLMNTVDNSVKNRCCAELVTLIKSLQSQECLSTTIVNVIVCVGIASNDDPDLFRIFKALKADVLINSVMLDALKSKDVNVQDICMYGMNTLNVFCRDIQLNSRVQTMIFNGVMKMVKMCFASDADEKIDKNVSLDLMRFVKNTIIRYSDQVELFVEAGAVEHLLNTLTTAKYPIQLAVLTIIVDLAMYQSARNRIRKWKCPETNSGYLEIMCEIWRRELVKFDFIDDDFVFREQRDKTTVENVLAGCSPAVESVFLCAQPKIYALFRLVAFTGPGFDDADHEKDDDHDEDGVREKTIRACRLVARLEDKATVAHVYHYYSLKLGEVWNENRVLLSSRVRPDDCREYNEPPAVESQSVAVMITRRAYLTALIRNIRCRVANLHQLHTDDSEMKLENELYEEIRRYYSNAH